MPDDGDGCGLLIPHEPHPYNDDHWCPGIPYGEEYTPRHAGTYRPEATWARHLMPAPRHRRDVEHPDMAGPPQLPRPRPRIGWDDNDKGDDRE